MNAFKGKDWVLAALGKVKRLFSKAQYDSLTDRIRDTQPLHRTESLLRSTKLRLLQGFGALGLLASLSIGGNQYVKLHTYEVFHVYVGDQQAGTVSDPQVVEDYIMAKVEQLEEDYPDVHMVLNADEVAYKAEKAYKIESDNAAALAKLGELLQAQAVGVQLIVNGEVVAIVKDKEVADAILEQVKSKYVPKKSGSVSILSAPPEPQIGQSVVESADFMEKIEMPITEIDPDDVMDPEEVVKKLETGDIGPSQYTVVSGDCVSCIASKLGISRQQIYENNEWIHDDKLQVGDVLDVTVLKPALTVRTVEKVVETEEIQHEIIYENDDTMRKGQTVTVKEGRNGLKKVIYQVVKANGYAMSEELVGEEVLEEPVAGLARRGTKVILGEGTGKFVWPVVSAKVTSSFGMRWGKMHKGIDITGNRNIVASDNGEVIYAGNGNDGYGNKVIIDHKNGYRTLYAHLSQLYTKKGAIVEKGEKIGYMGSTGNSTGVHLHFEVQRNGVAENPMKFLSR